MDGPVNQVDQRPFTSERFQAADFGGGRAIAQGIEQFGQGLQDSHDALDRLGKQYDEAAVKQADAQDLRNIMDIRAKALSATGFDAQPAIAEARKQIEDIRKARVEGLHNNRQRQMYTDVFDQRTLAIEESFATHSVQETKKAADQASVDRAGAYTDNAIETYGTKEFDVNLGTALNEVAAMNKSYGPETIARKQAEVKSSVYASVIGKLMADPDHIQTAKEAYAQHSKDLTPDDELKVLKQLNPLLEEDRTETDAGMIISGGAAPPGQAPTDPLAPKPDAVPGPAHAAPTKATSTDPIQAVVHGKGRITDNAAAHRARGSGNAVDIAAPAGTPIYTPMSGKVIKNWYDQKGGWSVLVQHPNGYVTGYAHMRSQSPLASGTHVEPDAPIGSVGATGDATGPHVHYTVRQVSGGPKVDPQVADWNGAPGSVDVNSNTVAHGKVDWKEGGLVKYNTEQNQLGPMLDRAYQVATAQGWSAHRYENAVARIRQIAGVQDQRYNQVQEDQYNVALKTVVTLGDKLTSVSQVPNFGSLDPAHQYSIQNIIKSNKNAEGEDAATAPFFDLYGMALDPARRSQFLKVDLLKVSGIKNGERKQLFNMQWDVRNDANGKYQGGLDEAYSAANRYLPTKEFKDDTRRQFTDRYMEAVTARQQELKRPLTDREKDDVARSLVVPVVRYDQAGKKQGETPLFQTFGSKDRRTVDIPQVFSTIAPATVQEIIAKRRAKGLSHSMKDVVTDFLEMSR
ncbi:MAG: M23 family metallopeptidase [Sphingomicrobium sp.]